MSDKYRKNRREERSQRDSFDDKYFSISDIPFKQIGQKIKYSINKSLKSLTKSLDLSSLPQSKNPKVCEQTPPEKNKYPLLNICGIILALISLTLVLVFMTEYNLTAFESLIYCILSLLIGGSLSAFSFKMAMEYKRLSLNYVRYLRELGTNTVISIRDLASGVSQSEEKTVKDLLYMMKKNYFKQARIVEDDSIFILDIPTFRLYKKKQLELDSYSKINPSLEEDEKLTAENISNERATQIISQTNDYLKKIRESKANIKNQAFKDRLTSLIKNIEDILSIISKYPDKAYALDKFSDYYLPTTLKLVASYEEFERLDTNQKSIITSMEEIDDSIKTISDAFGKMKADLYKDKAMDLKTDIDTIKLLLEQEGYGKEDFNKNE